MITTNELMTSAYQILVDAAAKIREDHPELTCIVTNDQRSALELTDQPARTPNARNQSRSATDPNTEY